MQLFQDRHLTLLTCKTSAVICLIPLKIPIVFFGQKRYLHCSVLVGSRNRFKRILLKQNNLFYSITRINLYKLNISNRILVTTHVVHNFAPLFLLQMLKQFTMLKVILCASEHICSIVRYCFRSFKQL